MKVERTLVTKFNLARWQMRVGEFLKQNRLVGEPPTELLGKYVCVRADENFSVVIEDPKSIAVEVCPKCHGTGEYVGPYSRGRCYDCSNGKITLRDLLRDRLYHSLNDSEVPAE
jgi:hypothetical protein